MGWLLAGVLLMLFSGVPGLFFPRDGRGGERLAAGVLVSGAALVAFGLWQALAHPAAAILNLPWEIPGGELALAVDPLAVLFILPLLLIAVAGSLFGLGYWPQCHHRQNGRKLRLFFGLICGGMLLVLLARNALLFLMAWELMALAGFFLVTTDEAQEEARRAGLIYLTATHTGTLALVALFALLGEATGSLAFPAVGSLLHSDAALFLLGLFGFGLKAGLMPLHIWLPGAHAAAPSHVSALLSGAMIKTGIYGLVRLTSFFAQIPPWWGWTILFLGVLSGVLGVALALAQHDLKRLLAYHSVENIGIIAIGLGLALLGRSYHQPALVLLGLGGALLHVLNHGLFKSLLFLSAGSVIHAVGSRQIDQLGGLLRRQPWNGVCFLGGAVAICGLPPFNGFISEWLIYLAALRTLGSEFLPLPLAVLSAPALALIGALAVACFVKVFGVVFLGEPRSAAAAQAQEAGAAMRLPPALLLLACGWIGLFPFTLASLLQQAAMVWSPAAAAAGLLEPLAPLGSISLAGGALLLTLAAGFSWLSRRSRGAPRTVSTWSCGFARPTARMQYTASSFADFLVGLFRFGLWSERHGGRVEGVLAKPAALTCHTPDLVLDRGLLPTAARAAWWFGRLRSLVQNGRISFYLLYVVLLLLVLLTAIFLR